MKEGFGRWREVNKGDKVRVIEERSVCGGMNILGLVVSMRMRGVMERLKYNMILKKYKMNQEVSVTSEKKRALFKSLEKTF